VLGMLLAWGRGAYGLDPTLDVSQYAHTAWKIRDGFAKGEILSVAQTPDGYLWVGTEYGLLRFDGVRAVPWQPPTGEQLPNNRIASLLTARDGTLWIATLKGLASWKDGKLTQYPEVAGQVVSPLLEDRQGTVWIGLYDPGRVCAIRAGKIECGGAANLGRAVVALYEDRKGNLWVSANGLWRWAPGLPEHYTFPRGVLEINSIIEDDSGALLLATNNGLKRLVNGTIEDHVLPGIAGQFRPNFLFRSSDGSLWVGTHQGVLHVHQGRTDRLTAAEGLSGDFIDGIFEDREGSVWVATQDGLDRFRDFTVPTISRNQGLPNSTTWSVQASPDGSIWIGTAGGLTRWENGHMTVYGSRKTLGQSQRTDEREANVRGAVTEIANSGLVGTPQTLGQDDRKRLWVSTSEGAFYFEGGRFIRVPAVPGGSIISLAGDGHGNVWILDSAPALFHVMSEGDVQRVPSSIFAQRWARALLPDQLQDGVWLGFYQGGLDYLKDSQVRTSYKAADGLGQGRVNGLRFGSRDTLWVATEGGLSRIKDGHIATLTSKNGLPCDEVHWSMEDDDHVVWLFMPCGLVRIEPSELDAWASDAKRAVQVTTFDSSNGVRSVGVYGSIGPHVAKSPDGRIWFITRDGVSFIDPRHLPFNKLPPPVHIDQITADRKTYWQNWSGDASSSHPKLPPLVRDLTIDYTALSLVVPEKVRFRYKLEGWDRDWQDAGTRRQAFYTNLAPRKYRFRVMACNNSGVWNEAGTFLDFSIAPAYWQTNWFRALCVTAFMVLLWMLYRMRLRQVARQFNIRLEERVNERTRLARDLHDTLLQSFQGLLLRFQTGINLLPERPVEARKTLESAVDQAAEAITEGRNAVQGLRSSTVETNDLALAINTLGEELAAGETNPNNAVFHVGVEGTTRDLHPILRDDVYRIAGEAMRNAFKHALAQRIELEIRYDERQFRLRVRDDGKGIDAKLLKEGERPGHYGFSGMRERAKLLGGKLTVWSELDAGTELELSIPATNAYATPDGGKRSWLAEKLSGKKRTS